MRQIISYLVLLISILWIGYGLERDQFYSLILFYTAGFAAFMFIYYQFHNKVDIKAALQLSYLLRIVLLFAIPNLSNDFYRFIWDGRMSVLGFNPFTVLPNEFIGTDNLALVGNDAQELFEGQGVLSPGNYTCYPPVNQLFFIIPAFLFPQNIYLSVILMRVMIIGAEIGTIQYGRKILKKLQLRESNILLYALNPLVVIELTGNLHFEAVTIFFLLVAIYFLLSDRWLKSSLFMMLSVSVKLIPLIFLPVLLKHLGQRKTLFYSLIVILGSTLLFLPFFNRELIENFLTSIDLYFRKFEFNASIYYLVRWIGYYTHGWNIIQKAGPLLAIAVFVWVIILSVVPKNQFPKQLINSMMFAIATYYFLSTTVHPWYIAVPLILSVFTPYRFVVIWSFLVILSYNAYQGEIYRENLWLNITEYGMVFGFMIAELLSSRKIIKT
ncbi:MAG: hypothetical protein K9G76_07295 [Bacteroidales bacterium]|nr:hypothetical protein [Bacteroidales bacterium]MCF8404592.1 hypothetical protein [Bacteroidales bacterium]